MAQKENVDPDLENFKTSKRVRSEQKKSAKRFKSATDDEEIQVLTNGYVPDNTKKNTAWAVKVFNEWRCAREFESPPNDILTVGDADQLNSWIPQFVNEARKADGCPYPPRSIHQLLAALQRYMLSENHLLPRFMDRNNAVFWPIHNACDSVYHSLHASGIGNSVRHILPL